MSEPAVPSFLAGTAPNWIPREPVLNGTRLHFVPQSVEGRPIVMTQKSKSGGPGRKKGTIDTGKRRCTSCSTVKVYPEAFIGRAGQTTQATCSTCCGKNDPAIWVSRDVTAGRPR